WFACENWDVVPDMITTAKGINSGYVPLGALTVRSHVYEAIKDKFFAGGLTYSGHPLACAAAVASIEAFKEEGIVENSAAMGRVLADELPKLAERHPAIGDVRGLGVFWGLELVRNRETREPLVPFPESAERVELPDCVLVAWPWQSPPAAAVHRLRFAGDAVERRIADVRAWFRERGRERFTWWVGDSATPQNLAERLRSAGAE